MEGDQNKKYAGKGTSGIALHDLLQHRGQENEQGLGIRILWPPDSNKLKLVRSSRDRPIVERFCRICENLLMFERLREDIAAVFERDPAARSAWEVLT